jgi:RHS repeat-associated protein
MEWNGDYVATWYYDTLGRQAEETLRFGAGGATRVVSREYNEDGQSALVYPNGRTLSYTRFDDGGLHEIGDDGWGNTRATYDYIGGRTLRRTLANGVNLDFRDGAGTHYDGLGRPLEWRHKNVSTGATIIGFEYAYDRAGNRLAQRSIHDPLDSQRYSYDSASRLVSASRGEFGEGDFLTSPSLYCESPTTATWTTEESAFQWGLDGAGNWDQYLTWKNTVETNQTRTDTNFNEIHQVGATTLTHNDHGDMTYDASHQYKWDAFGRLREVRSGGGTLQATYYYDADHRRVRKDFVSGTDLDFLYDGWRAIEIRKTATQLSYFQSIFGNYLDEQLEADYNGGTPDATCTGAGDAAYGIQNNALFSVYAVTRPDKSINSAFEYDPYGYPTRLIDGNDGDTTVNFNGNDTRAAGIGSTFLHSYTGQTFDPESGLLYYKRRYYHPALGRFISRDPIGYADGENMYAYVSSNPLLYMDPEGKIKVEFRWKVEPYGGGGTGAIIDGFTTGRFKLKRTGPRYPNPRLPAYGFVDEFDCVYSGDIWGPYVGGAFDLFSVGGELWIRKKCLVNTPDCCGVDPSGKWRGTGGGVGIIITFGGMALNHVDFPEADTKWAVQGFSVGAGAEVGFFWVSLVLGCNKEGA